MIDKRFADIISDITIQDGWELHLLEDSVYKDAEGNGRPYIQIQFDDRDNVTGEAYRSHCRKWYLSPYMTNQEIVRTAYKAYEAAILHEMQEKFLYRGTMIYGPHTNLEGLVEVGTKLDKRTSEMR